MIIDGNDISIYGLTLLKSEGELNFPKLKRPINNNRIDEHGVEIDEVYAYKEARTINMEFLLQATSVSDYLSKLSALKSALITTGLNIVTFDNIDKIFSLFVKEKVEVERLNRLTSELISAKVRVKWCEPDPTSDGRDIIVTTISGDLYRLKKNGAEIWNVAFQNNTTATIIDSLGNIVCGSSAGGGRVFDASDGTVISSNPSGLSGQNIYCFGLRSNGAIYVGTDDSIYLINTDYTNNAAWQLSPAYINNSGETITAILVTSTHLWIGLSVNGGTTLKRYAFNGGSQLLITDITETVNCLAEDANGKIYVGTTTIVSRFHSTGSSDGSWEPDMNENVNAILIKDTEIWIALTNNDIKVVDYNGADITIVPSGTDQYILTEQINRKVLSGETGVVRYNTDYTVDTTYINGIVGNTVNSIILINP